MICPSTTRARAPGRFVVLFAFAAPLAVGMPARAADMPDEFFLRGPVSSGVRWDGYQAGAQVGYVNSQTDFGHATRSTVENFLRQTTVEAEDPPSQWKVLGTNSHTGMSYGGFVGYNWHMDSIVVGIDAAYNFTDGISTNDGPARLARRTVTSDNGVWDVDIRARSSLTMHDYATLRTRVGYPAGIFLPYAFVGGALGRFDYRTRTSVTVTNGTVTDSTREVRSKDGAFSPGVTTGLGVDIAVLPNVYLRAEYEFIGFAEIEGIRPMTNTGRVGVGFRF